MSLDSSSEVSSVINAEAAVSEIEAEAATEAEAAKMEVRTISVNSRHIVRAEGNR
jgi:hypothetical protein